MAVTSTEQVALFRPSAGTTDSYAGDGAPLHSLLLEDLVRGSNNLFARCEPQMQFAFDAQGGIAAHNVGGALGLAGSTRWARVDSGKAAGGAATGTSSIPASGMAFLCQMPIVLPQGASRIITSIGFDRIGVGPDVGNVDIDVTQINYFLSPTPIANPSGPSMRWPVNGQEFLGNFLASDIPQAIRHDVTCAATAPTPSYFLQVDSSGWSAPNVANLNDRPIAWLIVGMTYSSATVEDYIYVRDFSIWGEFDGSSVALTMYDDAVRALCRNGQGATGRTMKDLLDGVISNGWRPRPVFNMWGGTNKINATGFIRQNWLNVNPASPGVQARFLGMSSTGALDSAQGLALSVGSVYSAVSADPPAIRDATNPLRYPTNSRPGTPQVVSINEIITAVDTKGKPYEILAGSNTANGPQLRSMCLYEWGDIVPVATSDPLAPRFPYDDAEDHGMDIIGTEAGDTKLRGIRAVRDYFRKLYKARRVHFGWSGINDTAPYDGYLAFTSSNYKYIFDTTFGQGGTAPAVTSPAITIPLFKAASGLNTRVRVYVSIYARQVGGGQGDLGVYIRNDDGVNMVGPTALTHSPIVTSSTWAWYGFSTPFNESNDSYFLANATLPYERMVLCARSSVGEFDIGAFTVASYHSEI